MADEQNTVYITSDLEPGDMPFDTDALERKELAEKLTRLVERMHRGGVISVDAPWGEGKTYFGRHWHKKLEQDGYRAIFIDAFQHDYLEDPFLLFTGEIHAFINKVKSCEKDQKVKDSLSRMEGDFLKKSMAVLKKVTPLAGKVGLMVAGRTLLGNANLSEEIGEGVKKILEDVEADWERKIAERIEKFEEEKNSVVGFKNVLEEYAKEQNKPLVIFVDELDRCRPDFAVRTLERIKHFFEVPNVVFVLLMNRAQLVEAIKGIYGQGFDGDKYLEKFILFKCNISPYIITNKYYGAVYHGGFVDSLLKRYGLPSTRGTLIMKCCVRYFCLTLRETERVLVNFLVEYDSDREQEVWMYISILKIAKPVIYNKIYLTNNRKDGLIEAKNILVEVKDVKCEECIGVLSYKLTEIINANNIDYINLFLY